MPEEGKEERTKTLPQKQTGKTRTGKILLGEHTYNIIKPI